MKIFLRLSTICLLMISLSTYAQTNVEFTENNFKSNESYKKALEHLSKGDEYFEDGEEWAHLANKEYLKANDLNPSNAKLNFRISSCYLLQNDLFNSLKYAKKAYALDSLVNPEILYRLGLGYQFRLQFKKAIDSYTQFKENLKGCGKSKWKKRVEKRIAECKYGKNNIENYKPGLVVNLKKINSKYIDHSPLPSIDETSIYFTSRRPVDTSNHEGMIQGRYLESVFVAKKNERGIWQPAESITELVSKKHHIATVAISDDQKTLYLYNSAINGGDLFVTHKTDTGWSQPTPLGKPINTKHKETGISFSPDGKNVYFVSDRPDGVGKKDIWIADINDKGKFINPRPLSETINTIYNERSVYIQKDGKTMYFSSEGHSSMGGFDIFKSTLDENGNWSTPENMGYPINTAGNDVFFIPTPNNKRGYFSALKLNTKGEQDIYTYIFPDEDGNIPADSLCIKGTVTDIKTGKPLFAVLKFSNNKGVIVKEILTDSITGKYNVCLPNTDDNLYATNVNSENYIPVSESINTEEEGDKDFQLDRIMLSDVDCKPIVLENVWFDFDSYKLRAASYETLNNLFAFLKDCENYNVEIDGHTCWMGSDAYNVVLSKNRAKSVVNYLTEKGLNTKRFAWKGFGEKDPMANNKTMAGRKKNRRVEFKLIKGELPFANDKETSYETYKGGYSNSNSSANSSNANNNGASKSKATAYKPGSGCDPIVIENVWFDFDSYELRSVSYETLDNLFAFLKDCKDYDVEIGGHTCWMGSNAYNVVLSKNRAQSVVNYLVKKGLDPNRFSWKNYSEDIPMANNETMSGRQKNRRVEFKLVKK